MNDMSGVITPKSDQINADTLLAGPMTVTIADVQIRGGQEQPVSITLEETDLAFRPCKSMSRVLVHAWGPDANAYKGRSLTLYRDPDVKWGGLAVGGIRISHLSHIDGKLQLQLTATKGQRKPHVVLPLVLEQRRQANAKPADIAQDWTRKHLAEIDRTDSENALEALIVKRRDAVAKLHADHPALASDIAASYAARAGTLAQIGRTDAQHGDQFDGFAPEQDRDENAGEGL